LSTKTKSEIAYKRGYKAYPDGKNPYLYTRKTLGLSGWWDKGYNDAKSRDKKH
jgi:hypothetical protein